jgi:hypothetical protein
MSPPKEARTSMDEVGTARWSRSCWCCARCSCRPLFISGLSGAVLPAVRGDDLGRDGDLAARVADAVAGARRAAAEAARRASRAGQPWCAVAVQALRRRLQPRLRAAERLATARLTRAAGASRCPAMMVYAVLIARRCGCFDHADRLHPGAGPGLFPRPSSSCRPAPRWSAPTRCAQGRRSRILPIDGVEGAVMLAGFDGASRPRAQRRPIYFR